ncbi:MAG TPA: hypothetical protein VGK59_23530 [Ohtaekwangia sp.]
MKLIKGLLLFGLLVAGTSSCFEPPDFADEPKINLDDIYFGVSPSLTDMDSVVIELRFEDGDGNLGLVDNQQENFGLYIAHTSDPFHPNNYFLADNGNLTPVTTFTGYSNDNRTFTPVLNLQPNQQGMLATDRTRNEPGYEDLEPNTFPDKCYHYTNVKLYIVGDDSRVIDDTYNIIDTIRDFEVPLYVVEESFYTEKNPNHFNIFVDWLVYDPGIGDYVEYNWEESSLECAASFDGRFPVISQTDTPLEGVIRYSMKSNGFLIILGFSKFKLRIRIQDTDLNSSNIIETPEYTLQDIRL